MTISYTDNTLIAKMISELNLAFSTYPFPTGFGKVTVQQKQQPSQQGVPNGPCVFIEKLFDNRYGFMMVDIKYDPITDSVIENQTQVYQTTFQLSALSIQKPSDTTLPTASDLVSTVCQIFQGRAIIRRLSAAEIGVLRVSEIKNTYFTDDRDRQEAHPTFDLVLTYNRMLPPAHIPKLQQAATVGSLSLNPLPTNGRGLLKFRNMSRW